MTSSREPVTSRRQGGRGHGSDGRPGRRVTGDGAADTCVASLCAEGKFEPRALFDQRLTYGGPPCCCTYERSSDGVVEPLGGQPLMKVSGTSYCSTLPKALLAGHHLGEE